MRQNKIGILVGMVLAFALPLRATTADDLEEATELRSQGNNAAADVVYQLVLAADPDNADAKVGRGFCLLAQPGKSAPAAELFKDVLVVYPAYVDAALGLATALKRMNNLPDAERILRNSRGAVDHDAKLLEYLVQHAWDLGFVEFARDLDMRHPPKKARQLVEQPNRIIGEFSYSALADGNYWVSAGGTYLRFLRPDAGFTLKGGGYRRPYGTESVVGAGLFYRIRNRLTLAYDFSYATPGDFKPLHQHMPMLKVALATGNLIGVGAHFASYNSGWLQLGILFMEQRMRNVVVRMTGKSGQNPAGDPVMSVMFTTSIGAEGNNIYKFGAAYGNETEDISAEVISTDIQVVSLFGMVTMPFSEKMGVTFSGAGEWREEAYFRTVLGVAPYISF